jgi:hypothetical protein
MCRGYAQIGQVLRVSFSWYSGSFFSEIQIAILVKAMPASAGHFTGDDRRGRISASLAACPVYRYAFELAAGLEVSRS